MRRFLPPVLIAVSAILGACGQPVRVSATPEPVPETGSLVVYYVGNEGFVVENAGRRVLIDGLIGVLDGYIPVPGEIKSQLETGEGDWGGIDVAAASHYHRDHFNPGSVARFLLANPRAEFVSTPQARIAFEEHLSEDPASRERLLERFHAALPAEGETLRLGFGGITIDVLNLHHGRRTPPVENLGLLVTLGNVRFLHFGDTEAKMEHFEPYLPLLADTDLALLPFWFLSSEWRAEMVRERIRPRWVIAGHMPTRRAGPNFFGRWENHANLVATMRAAFPDALIPDRPGAVYRLSEPES